MGQTVKKVVDLLAKGDVDGARIVFDAIDEQVTELENEKEVIEALAIIGNASDAEELDAFAKANHQHFQNPAAERSSEIGMRLDPVDDDNSIGLERFNTAKNLDAILCFSDALGLHGGPDRSLEIGF